ncbi:MAG: hypothetical protein ACLFPR_08645, partial [Desulfococcaceae bacterium]
REKEDDALQGKFFASASPEAISYGFYIERTKEPDLSRNDWDSFIAWLREPENEAWFLETAKEQNLTLYDLKNTDPKETSFSGEILPKEEGWELSTKGEDIPNLADFLENLPQRRAIDLMIARHVPKEEAAARGADIANDIAGLFEILMPLYQAATSHFHR